MHSTFLVNFIDFKMKYKLLALLLPIYRRKMVLGSLEAFSYYAHIEAHYTSACDFVTVLRIESTEVKVRYQIHRGMTVKMILEHDSTGTCLIILPHTDVSEKPFTTAK
jgi:hypothetical protein